MRRRPLPASRRLLLAPFHLLRRLPPLAAIALLTRLDVAHLEADRRARERQERLDRLRQELAKAAAAGVPSPRKGGGPPGAAAPPAALLSPSALGQRVLSQHEGISGGINPEAEEAAARVGGLLAMPERPGAALGDLMSRDESRKALLALGPDLPPSVLTQALRAPSSGAPQSGSTGEGAGATSELSFVRQRAETRALVRELADAVRTYEEEEEEEEQGGGEDNDEAVAAKADPPQAAGADKGSVGAGGARRDNSVRSAGPEDAVSLHFDDGDEDEGDDGACA